MSGDCRGEFDASRVREALLVANAAVHGVPHQPVEVNLEDRGTAVQLTVPIAVEESVAPVELERSFEPLRRVSVKAHSAERTHWGLGLSIVKEIAKVHGGNATAHCDGTTAAFMVSVTK